MTMYIVECPNKLLRNLSNLNNLKGVIILNDIEQLSLSQLCD